MRFDLPSGYFLRPIESDDAKALFALVDRDRAHLRDWLPWVDGTRLESDTRDFIDFALRSQNENKGLVFVIFSAQTEIAGVVAFNSIDHPNQKATIGYWLGKESRGRGVMTQAVDALIRHAFVSMSINRVEIRCAVGNLSSQKIPERLGFHFEGVAREYERVNKRFLSHRVYSKLKSDGV